MQTKTVATVLVTMFFLVIFSTMVSTGLKKPAKYHGIFQEKSSSHGDI